MGIYGERRFAARAFVCIFLASCTGLSVGVTGPESALGGDGLNTSLMSAPAASGLDLSIDGLQQRISPFNGLLSVQVPVYRVGHHTGHATYQNANDYSSIVTPRRTFTGLPFQWHRPWVARLVLSHAGAPAPHTRYGYYQQPQGATITYGDGHTETLFAPIPDGLPLPGQENAEPLDQRTTSALSRWRWLSPSNEYQLTTQDGTRYVFRGACWDNPNSRDGMCDAHLVEDAFGNGLRITYYGESDSDAANDTSVPRKIESYRRDGAQYTTTGIAYFYLRGAYSGDTPPLSEPADVLDIPAGRDNFCETAAILGQPCAHIPGWLSPSHMIGAIAYPGPSSSPTEIDASWHHTRFQVHTSQYHVGNYNGVHDWSQLRAIETEGKRYAFSYGGAPEGDRGIDGIHGPNHPPIYGTAGRISTIHLPHSQSIYIDWEEFSSVGFAGGTLAIGGNNPVRSLGVSHWELRNAGRQEAGQARPTSYHWTLHHQDIARGGNVYQNDAPGPNAPVRFHAAIVTYPTGMSTVMYFHPLANVGWPAAAKSGQLAEVRTFSQDLWDDENNQLIGGSLDSQVPQHQIEYGYAVFARGALMLQAAQVNSSFSFSWTLPGLPQFNQDSWRNENGIGWVALPSFQVETRLESTEQTWDWCESGWTNGASVTCAGNGAQGLPQCFSGDGVFDTLQACHDAIYNDERCYSTTLGNVTRYCGSFDGPIGGSTSCPAGSSAVATCNPAPTVERHSVVTRFRENRPLSLALETATSNAHADYDQFGNRAFIRRYAAGGPVTITRPGSFCGSRCTVDYNGSGWSCPQDWQCPQDTVDAIYPEDTSLIEETRFVYVTEDSTLAPDYLGAGITGLPMAVSRCAAGTTCTQGFGLISRTELSYDNRGTEYPFADAPGDHGTQALGRLTTVRRLNLESPSESEVQHYNYYVGTVGQPSGALAESAQAVDANRHERMRYSYAGNPGSPSMHPTSVSVLDEQGSPHVVREASFNAWGDELMARGENGETTRSCYDQLGRRTATFLPNDTFSSCDNISAATQQLAYPDSYPQRVISTTRIVRGNQVHTVRESTVFDGLSRPIHTQADIGAGQINATSRRYFAHTDLVTAETEPYTMTGVVGETTAYGYDHPRSETAYDSLGRILSHRQLEANGSVVSQSSAIYGDHADLLWNEMRITDVQGQQIVHRSDPLGRPTETVLADGAILRARYDRFGQIASVRQPDGLETVTQRDSLGRIVSDETPEAGTTTAAYDRAGRMIRIRRANGQETRLEYDYRGRLRRRLRGTNAVEANYFYDTYQSGSSVTHNQFAQGRVTRVEFEEGNIEYGYQLDGSVTQQVTNLNGLPQKFLRRNYDSIGNIRSQTYQNETDIDNSSLAFVTASDSYELRSVLSFGQEIERFGYDVFGRVSTRQLRNGAALVQQEDYSYDSFSRLRGVNDPENLGDDAFAYRLRYADPMLGGTARRDNNPSEVEWARSGVSRAAYVLSYDSRGRLTNADFRERTNGSWQNPSQYDMGATYSAIGQIQTLTRVNNQGVAGTTAFTYDAATRRLTSTSGATNAALTYDASGNVRTNTILGAQSTLGHFGSRQRPRYVANGQTRTEYGYDDQGYVVRIAEQHLESPCRASGVDIEGNAVRAEVVQVGERGGAPRGEGRGGSPEGGGPTPVSVGCYVTDHINHIVRDPDGGEVAEYRDTIVTRLAEAAAGYRVPAGHGGDPLIAAGNYYTLTDHLGSVRVVINQAGVVQQGEDFDPYGLPLAGRGTTAPSAQWRSFATYREQSHSGSYQLAGARLYSPELGRFLSPDPLADADPVNHAYAYAQNTPCGLNDPTGLCGKCPFGAGGFTFGDLFGLDPEIFATGSLGEVTISAKATPASAGTAANSFIGGFVQGAIATALVVGVLSVLAAPVAAVVGTVLLVATVYNAIENRDAIMSSGERLLEGRGTADDYFALGNLTGSLIAGGPRFGRSGRNTSPSGVAVMEAGIRPKPRITSYPRDWPGPNLHNRSYSAYYASEQAARTIARAKLGRNPVQVEPNKFRSRNGQWQYRAKPGDLQGDGGTPHVHLERLNPRTGEVLENWHLRWDPPTPGP